MSSGVVFGPFFSGLVLAFLAVGRFAIPSRGGELALPSRGWGLACPSLGGNWSCVSGVGLPFLLGGCPFVPQSVGFDPPFTGRGLWPLPSPGWWFDPPNWGLCLAGPSRAGALKKAPKSPQKHPTSPEKKAVKSHAKASKWRLGRYLFGSFLLLLYFQNCYFLIFLYLLILHFFMFFLFFFFFSKKNFCFPFFKTLIMIFVICLNIFSVFSSFFRRPETPEIWLKSRSQKKRTDFFCRFGPIRDPPAGIFFKYVVLFPFLRFFLLLVEV